MANPDILLEQDRISVVGGIGPEETGGTERGDLEITTAEGDPASIRLNADRANLTLGGGSGAAPEGDLRLVDENENLRIQVTAETGNRNAPNDDRVWIDGGTGKITLGDGENEGEGGTILFTGATSSVRGRGGAAAFSSAKFAVRGLAESMAREFGPQGVHVAHVVIDGGIRPPGRDVSDPEAYLDPDAIADSYWHLVQQDRSAWTLELDLRPHVEEF